MKTQARGIARCLICAGALVCVLLFARPAYAGTIQLEVRDCNDRLLNGVTVELWQEVGPGPPPAPQRNHWVQVDKQTTRNGVVQFAPLSNARYCFFVNCPAGGTVSSGPITVAGTQTQSFSAKCCEKLAGLWDGDVPGFTRVVFELKIDGSLSITKERGGKTFRGEGYFRQVQVTDVLLRPCGIFQAVYEVEGQAGCFLVAAAIEDNCALMLGQSPAFQTPENPTGRFSAVKR